MNAKMKAKPMGLTKRKIDEKTLNSMKFLSQLISPKFSSKFSFRYLYIRYYYLFIDKTPIYRLLNADNG